MEAIAVLSAASGTQSPGRRSAYGTLESLDAALVLAETPDGTAGACVDAALVALTETEAHPPDRRIRAAFAAAEKVATDLPALSMVVLVLSGDRAHTGQIGATTRACVIRDETLVALCPGVGPESIHLSKSAFSLRQSDQIVLLTSGIANAVEPVLLPVLTARRPPERCVDSILTVAQHRGLDDDFVLLVAAWQDPALVTLPNEFSVRSEPSAEAGAPDTSPDDRGLSDFGEVFGEESPSGRRRKGFLLDAARSLFGLGR